MTFMPCEGPRAEDVFWHTGLVECLLDELNGIDRSEIIRQPWKHPAASATYFAKQSDSRTALLCERLRKEDVTMRSLELQMWWRDHKKRDKARVLRTLQEAQSLGDAIDGLSEYERELAGVRLVGPFGEHRWEYGETREEMT
jgi:hypothetical protein